MKICIITPDYLASTPRVVKEADALAHAGHDVRVIFSEGPLEYLRRYDDGLHAGRAWRFDSIRWSRGKAGERCLYWYAYLRSALLRAIPMFFWGVPGLLGRLAGLLVPELARRASRERADLYIGHYPAGLIAAATAARRWKTRYAFDVEDLHVGEDLSGGPRSRRSRMIEKIESLYVPPCAYVSASSMPIADEMKRRYGASRSIVVHNAFPLDDRHRLDGKIRDRQGKGLSLYWFSQTLGPLRGLEDAVAAVGRVRGDVHLHLRGTPAPGALDYFKRLAREFGSEGRVTFHGPVPPDELLSRAAEHDVGLALEHPVSLNRSLCASNKVFMYLLAGLAVAATRTAGQVSVLSTVPGVLFYSPGDASALAAQIQRWVDDPALLATAKASALQYAEKKWNWETERLGLLEAVAEVAA